MLTFSALPQPKLTVNPQMITETDSVTLNCQTPSSVSVSQCYFHFVRGRPAKPFSCLKTLTGTELLKMSYQSSPAEVKVTCLYLHESPSPESDTSSIIIRCKKTMLLWTNIRISFYSINTNNKVTHNGASVFTRTMRRFRMDVRLSYFSTFNKCCGILCHCI